jgi:hypothetical protein
MAKISTKTVQKQNIKGIFYVSWQQISSFLIRRVFEQKKQALPNTPKNTEEYHLLQVQVEGEPVDENPGWRPRCAILWPEERAGRQDYQVQGCCNNKINSIAEPGPHNFLFTSSDPDSSMYTS